MKKDIKRLHYIKECIDKVVKSYLNEAMDDSFNLDELSGINSYNGRVRYCNEHLGFPIGNGSSRMVFQIDDEKCLKLAKNRKGIAQNEVEYDKYAESYGVTPNLYNCADDYSWIISEYVLPAKVQDFKECLGIDFQTFQQFVIKCYNCYAKNGYSRQSAIDDEYFEELLDNNEWLHDLYYYMTDYQLPYGDIIRKANLGMVMRDSEPQIVILDTGLNNDVHKQYYC